MQSINSLNSLTAPNAPIAPSAPPPICNCRSKKVAKKGVFHYKNYNFALGIVTNCKQYSLQNTLN